MKVASVASVSFSENAIEQKIVLVDDDADWKMAFSKAVDSGLYGSEADQNLIEWVMSLPDTLDDARTEIVNGDMDISVEFLELPSDTHQLKNLLK